MLPVLSEIEFQEFILSSVQDTKRDGEISYSPAFDDLYSLYTKV